MRSTIYHNPKCGTSRNVLAMLREAGLEPRIVESLNTPPDAATLRGLIAAMGLTPRALLRSKEAPYGALGLGDPALADAVLIDAMVAHPILMQRPIVVTEKGTRLGRPVEAVREILP